MQFQDLTGQRFNKVTIISHVGKNRTGQSLWLCRCDCGNEKVIAAHHLKSGNIKSCGCLLLSDNRANSARRHGGTKTPEWTSYHAAKKRCNPKFADKWPDYAGRGIQFKFKDFKEFLDHIGPRPEPKFNYSLDRIENDGHYEIGNVKWATKKQQARNRRCDNCEMLKRKVQELEAHIELLEKK
jgi:hypothetical protein